MDVVLVGFVGAGFALWAAGLGEDVPPGGYSQSVDNLRRMARVGDRLPVEALIEALVREVWQEWRNSRRSRKVFVEHLAAVPRLLETHRPDPGLVTGCIAEAAKIRRSGGSIEVVAHRLTSDIVLKARTAGDIAAGKLDETLVFFLLARLISGLLMRADALHALRPAILAAFGRADAAPADEVAVPAVVPADVLPATPLAPDPDVALLASAYSVPPKLLAATLRAAASGRERAIPAADREPFAVRCAELILTIATAAADRSGTPAGQALDEVARCLDDGQISDADQRLAEAELESEAWPHAGATDAESSPSGPNYWRVLRGLLAELDGRWHIAARHYAYAASTAARLARHERGPLLMRQARALVSQGVEHGDEKALIEAAQVYAEAGGFLSEQSEPMAWAAAHLELGDLMLTLGARETRPERFLAAALHFKPAVDVFSRHRAMDEWVQAQLGLAEALQRTGEFQGDVVTLGDAAFAFRAALGLLTKDRTPQEWADAQLGLGATLVRIAEETGESEPLESAVPALMAAMAQPPEAAPALDMTSARIALGRAYASLAADKQDETMLQEAISLFERALCSGGRSLAAHEVAAVERIRGSALWTLGESRASLRLLEDAVRAKLAALEHYESAGDVITSSRLREDLDDLAEAIAQLDTRRARPAVSREATPSAR